MTFRVLIVEDDIQTSAMIAATLRDYGLETGMVHDGKTALKEMLRFRPHLVILDLELPHQYGHEIFRNMTLFPELRNVLVIGNSIHFHHEDDLGTRFYNVYLLSRQETPLYVRKSHPERVLYNDLTALVAYSLAREYGVLPRPLADYLDKAVQHDALVCP